MTEVTLRLEAYARSARSAVAAAQGLADDRGNPEVEPLHLLYRLVESEARVQAALAQLGAEPQDVLVEAELLLRRLPRGEQRAAYLSPRMLELLGRAEGEASRDGGAEVRLGHLLLAAAQETSGPVHTVLRACGVSAPTLRAALAEVPTSPTTSSTRRKSQPEPSSPPTPRRDSAFRSRDPLERYGVDLTRQAHKGDFDPIVGRDGELRRMLQVLARRHENNPLLVGEPGVGKTSIVRALCLRIAKGDVPTSLKDRRVVELDPGLLAAGTRLKGELTERVGDVLQACRDAGGEVLLYLRDLNPLLTDGAPDGITNLLARALREGELRLIAMGDPSGVQRVLGPSSPLTRHFVRIDVDPPNEAEAVAILRGVVGQFEMAHGLSISDPALTTAASLAKRYLPHIQLPKSAIDLLDEAAARVRVEMESVPASLDQKERRLDDVELQLSALKDDHDPDSVRHRQQLEQEKAALSPQVEQLRERWHGELNRLVTIKELREEIGAAERAQEAASASGDRDRAGELRFTTLPELRQRLTQQQESLAQDGTPMVRWSVGEQDVAQAVADWTGIPADRMLQSEADKLLRMEERLGKRVIGQSEAVSAVSKAVRRGRVGLRDAKRPIGSFLFLGSSGVGKTELAKALAEFLFDDEAALTRLDMSEFMEKHTVARLLGAPPGYVDSEEGGFLTEAVRRKPYSVVLFDEVEKAHPDVFNILLQVLDDGRLTDSRGRLAHFSDTVIIMTSNLGARLMLEHEGGREALREKLQPELLTTFRPELLNRIDDVILFDALDRQELTKIADIQLRKLGRLLSARQLSLEVDAAARTQLVERGYEPAYGARPLQRAIRRALQDPLAEEVLRGGYQAGDTILVSYGDGAFQFQRRPA